MTRARPMTAVALATVFVTLHHVRADEPSAADFIPEHVAAAITIEDADERLGTIRAFFDEQGLAGVESWQPVLRNPGLMQARLFFQGIAAESGTDLWGGIDAILGRELTIGLAPDGRGGTSFIAASIVRDEKLVDRIADTAHAAAGSMSRDVAGVTVFGLGEDAYQFRVGPALVVTNSRDLGTAAIRAHAAKKGRLTDAKAFVTARGEVPDDAAAWSYLTPQVIESVTAEGENGIPSNALGAYLLGGWWTTLERCNHATAWLVPGTRSATVHLIADTLDAIDGDHAGYVSKVVDAVPTPGLPDSIASLTVHRGWLDLFAARESVLSIAAANDLVNFAQVMSTILGVDFVDDIMGRVDGPVSFLVGMQDFARLDPVPTPKLPSFALAIPLDLGGGQSLERRLNSSGLTAASLINAGLAEEGNETYLVDIEPYRDLRLIVMSYPPPDDGDDATMMGSAGDIQYNFAPAAALVADHYVVSTTAAQCREVIDALLDQDDTLTTSGEDVLAIDAGAVKAILGENHDELVANRMLSEDQSRADASRDIDAMLALLDLIESLELVSRTLDTGSSATIDIAFPDAP